MSRPGLSKTIIDFYSEERQIGKNELLAHLESVYDAAKFTAKWDADTKVIIKKYEVTDEQMGVLTPFQMKPMITIDLTADDVRINQKFYNQLEALSNGAFLPDGKWSTPPWIIVMGNAPLDPHKLSSWRLLCYYITGKNSSTPYTIKFQKGFANKVVEKAKIEEEMAEIAEQEADTGKPREVVIFDRLYCQGSKPESMFNSQVIEELIVCDPFFQKFRHVGKTVRYERAEFKRWVNEHFPQIKVVNHHGHDNYYTGLKRKREDTCSSSKDALATPAKPSSSALAATPATAPSGGK